MMMKATEIENAVIAIEEDIYNSSGVEYFNLTLITNGFVQIVEFAGIRLWDSEDDCRPYYDDDESDESKREPIESHLRAMLRAELSKLATIKV